MSDMNDQRTRCMQFLYAWVTKGHLSNMRKGQVEELQAFLNSEIAQDQAQKTAARIEAQQDSIVGSTSGAMTLSNTEVAYATTVPNSDSIVKHVPYSTESQDA